MLSSGCPEILYKYLGPGSGLKVLTSSSIRFTPPLDLNDPFESRIPIARPFRRSVVPGRWAVFPDDQKAVFKSINATFGVSCFSESCDNLLMWAHYANAHAGIVIGFRVKSPSFLDLGRLMPIRYLSRRPVLRMTPSEETVLQLLGTKSRDWVYEREWRLGEKLRDCIRFGKVWVKRFNPEDISVVIVGAAAERSLRKKVRRWHEEHPDAKLFQAYRDTMRFGLHFEDATKREPDVIVTDPKHMPVGYNLPAIAILSSTKDGPLVIRDLTDEVVDMSFADPAKRRAIKKELAAKRGTAGQIFVLPTKSKKPKVPPARTKRKPRSSGVGTEAEG